MLRYPVIDGNGPLRDGRSAAHVPVEGAFARDGTPVFGFETDAARAGERLVVASARSARRIAERLVEYETYDVAVDDGERTRNPATDGRYDEVTRHRLTGRAYDRLYRAYLRLGGGGGDRGDGEEGDQSGGGEHSGDGEGE